MRKIIRNASGAIVFIIFGSLLYMNQVNSIFGPFQTIFTWILFVASFVWMRFFGFPDNYSRKNAISFILLTQAPYFLILIAAIQVSMLVKKGVEPGLLLYFIMFLLGLGACMLVSTGVLYYFKNRKLRAK